MASIQRNEIQQGEVASHIDRGYTVLTAGDTSIIIYTQGSTNIVEHRNVPVTAIREPETMLVDIARLPFQRGGSPFHGIYMPSAEDGLIAQPGPQELHGSWAGLPWQTEELDESGASVTMRLDAKFWIGEIVAYYTHAAGNRANDEQKGSYERMLFAVKKRYPNDRRVTQFLAETRNKPNDVNIRVLVGLLYPGEVSVLRKVQISQPFGDGITVVDDIAQLTNDSLHTDASHSVGFHTYWYTDLENIILNRRSLLNGVALYPGYDENLNDVQVRIINQTEVHGRIIAIVPVYDLARADANQVIYHDHNRMKHPRKEVAIENNTQQGGLYPTIGQIIKPEEKRLVGFQTVIIDIDTVSSSAFAQVQDAINSVQQDLNAPPIDLYAL